MAYHVTYVLFFADKEADIIVQVFNYFPTLHDINEVGCELMAQHKAANFCASRGRNTENGWVYDEDNRTYPTEWEVF